MISDEGKGKGDVEEQAHLSIDDRGPVARQVGVSKHTIYPLRRIMAGWM